MTLKEMIEIESSVEQIVSELRNKLISELTNAEIPGVKKISPIVSIVNFSSLDKTILSAEYYNVDSQAKYIEQYLMPVKTVTSLASKLQDIISTEKVKLGSNTYFINPNVIKVIKEFINNN